MNAGAAIAAVVVSHDSEETLDICLLRLRAAEGVRLREAIGPEPVIYILDGCHGDGAAMQGLSLRNVELTVLNGKNKPVFREFGEMLFTHFGVSGPLMLSASAHLRRWEGEHYTIEIDLKPALDEQKLDARVLRDIGENPNREMGTIAAGLVPHSMAPVVLRRAGLTGSEKANSLTIPYQITPRRPGDIATCYADPKRAREMLGWEAHRNLQDMCRDAWNWQKQNPKGYGDQK